jgi:hypothetical protein
MKHIKMFEEYQHPDEVLIGQIWYGGHYDYEYENGDYREKDKYYIVITEIDEKFQIIRFDILNKKKQVKRKDSDFLSSFIDRFKYITDSIENLDVQISANKYNI